MTVRHHISNGLLALLGLPSTRKCLPQDSADWQKVPRLVIQQLLIGVAYWVKGPGRDLEVPPPQTVVRGSLVSRLGGLRLSSILVWALTGDPEPAMRDICSICS